MLHRAGFVDVAKVERANSRREAAHKPELPILPAAEVRRRGLEAIDQMTVTDGKRNRMKASFTAYMDGQGLPTVARNLGMSKGAVSLYLNQIERAMGAAVIRRPGPVTPPVIRGSIHSEDDDSPRLMRGSVRGWHSFRTTFITLALSAGMPIELVRRVTGHTTVDVYSSTTSSLAGNSSARPCRTLCPNCCRTGTNPPSIRRDRSWKA